MSNTESAKSTKIPKSAKIVSKKNCKNDNSDPKNSLDNKVNFGQTNHPTKLEELMDELRSIRKVYDTDPKKFFQLLEGVVDRHDKLKALEKDK